MDKQENTKVSVGIPKTLHARVKKVANENGLSINAVVSFAIMQFLDQRDAFAVTELYKKLEAENIKKGLR